jgi:hypothetical protein
MELRFIANDFPRLLNISNTGNHLKAALEDIVTNYGPQDEYPIEVLRGVWSGPTGIAYLFLHVSVEHPKLLIAGQTCLSWAKEYIRGNRHHSELKSKGCGIFDERLAFEAVRASVSKDLSHVRNFVSHTSRFLSDEYPEEMLHGRAGTLYLLRMIRHWVPNSAPLVERSIVMVTNKIMEKGPNWTWHGVRYLGSVHGDIGIITQLVITTPPLAPRLEEQLGRLLDQQFPSGNWPSAEGRTNGELVQFCHGAPGFITSLLSLRPFFPSLQDKIDECIKKGRELIWKEGLLRKEPSICHGVLGNALWVTSLLCR